MKAATAAANVAWAGEPASRVTRPATRAAAAPTASVVAVAPAAATGAAPDRRGARDPVLRRSPRPSLDLMTRAYVSLIGSHAARLDSSDAQQPDPAFTSAWKRRRFPSRSAIIEHVCDWQADPRRGAPWLRGEASGMPGL